MALVPVIEISEGWLSLLILLIEPRILLFFSEKVPFG